MIVELASATKPTTRQIFHAILEEDKKSFNAADVFSVGNFVRLAIGGPDSEGKKLYGFVWESRYQTGKAIYTQKFAIKKLYLLVVVTFSVFVWLFS